MNNVQEIFLCNFLTFLLLFRVLHAFGSHPPSSVMPVELAACLSLSQRQPLHQLLSMSSLRSTQRLSSCTDCDHRAGTYSPRHSSTSSSSSSVSSSSSSSSLPPSPSPSEPQSCFRRDSCGLKKRVVFADAKGLALTAVRLFIPEPLSSSPSYSPLPSLMMRRFGTKLQTPSRGPAYKLRLAFTQPSLDFKVFLSRQRDVGVQLESCSISEYSLSGKVRVSHFGFDQTVQVRMTFDSWRSHYDIPCSFLQQQRCGALDTDVFAFDLSLPQSLDPEDGIEFCVSYRPDSGAAQLWDDNRGQNYRIHIDKDSNSHPGDMVRGSPTLSRQHPASWPSHMTPIDVQSFAELSYLRSLSRVGTEWKMCPVK